MKQRIVDLPGVSEDMPVAVQRTWLRSWLPHGGCITLVGGPCGASWFPRSCMESECKAELGLEWPGSLSARLETRTEESMELAEILA